MKACETMSFSMLSMAASNESIHEDNMTRPTYIWLVSYNILCWLGTIDGCPQTDLVVFIPTLPLKNTLPFLKNTLPFLTLSCWYDMARLPSSSSFASWFPSTVMEKRDRTVYAKWILNHPNKTWCLVNPQRFFGETPVVLGCFRPSMCHVSAISPIFSRQLNPYIYAGEAPEISGGSTDQPILWLDSAMKLVGFCSHNFHQDVGMFLMCFNQRKIGSRTTWMKIKRNRDGGRSNIEVGCNSLLLNMTQSLL